MPYKSNTPHAAKGSVRCICCVCGAPFQRGGYAARTAKYCSSACQHRAQRTQDIAAKILSQRTIAPVTGCWLWTKGCFSSGYGAIQWQGRQMKVHRVAAILWLGMGIDDKRFVCHRCDTPQCFNPDHLFLGSAADNSHDAVRKHRLAEGARSPHARLTPQQVHEIRTSHEGGATVHDLAVRFRVSNTTIRQIVTRHTWKDID